MPVPSIDLLLRQPIFRARLEAALPHYLEQQRWFTSKGQGITEVRIQPLPRFGESGCLSLLHITLVSGLTELRVLPLAVLELRQQVLQQAQLLLEKSPTDIGVDPWQVIDAVHTAGFRESLYSFMAREGRAEDESGYLYAEAGPLLRKKSQPDASELPAQNSSNTVITYQPDGFLKLFRKTEPGLHPDAELIGYLSSDCDFACVPKFGGALYFQPSGESKPLALALMLGTVENNGEAWFRMLDDVEAFAKTYKTSSQLRDSVLSDGVFDELRFEDLPSDLAEAVGGSALQRIVLLGQRTAEMHLHFAAGQAEGLLPQDLDADYWAVAKTQITARLEDERLKAQPQMQATLGRIAEWLQQETLPSLRGGRIRVHGDYHLGQVLDTADDVVIIDFEGEPLHALEYRRQRHPAFKDVAGMLRSLHYAPYAYILQNTEGKATDLEAASLWYRTASRLFLTAYLDRVGQAAFLPSNKKERQSLLGFFLLDKALYELAYERASRPDWLRIPQAGLEQVVGML